MSDDLLPCPFCGGKAIPATHDHGRMWVIRCRDCTAEVWEKNDGHHHQDFTPIINAAWNRRAGLLAAAEARIAELEAVLEAARPYTSPMTPADYGMQLRRYEALVAAVAAADRAALKGAPDEV